MSITPTVAELLARPLPAPRSPTTRSRTTRPALPVAGSTAPAIHAPRLPAMQFRVTLPTRAISTTPMVAGSTAQSSSPAIADNVISNNGALGICGTGGGICCRLSSSPVISGNTITGNRAINTSGTGGGIACDTGSPVIANNAILGNFAGYTGGAVACGSSSTLVNNTICGNSAPNGGGIYCSGSMATIANTIVAFNSSGYTVSVARRHCGNNCVYGNTDYNYSGMPIPPAPTATSRSIRNWRMRSTATSTSSRTRPASMPATTPSSRPAGRTSTARPACSGAHVDIGADESDGDGLAAAGPAHRPRQPRRQMMPTTAPPGRWPSGRSRPPSMPRPLPAGSLGHGRHLRRDTHTCASCVHVYGGFAGTETERRSQRNWSANVTILDGNQGRQRRDRPAGLSLGARSTASPSATVQGPGGRRLLLHASADDRQQHDHRQFGGTHSALYLWRAAGSTASTRVCDREQHDHGQTADPR